VFVGYSSIFLNNTLLYIKKYEMQIISHRTAFKLKIVNKDPAAHAAGPLVHFELSPISIMNDWIIDARLDFSSGLLQMNINHYTYRDLFFFSLKIYIKHIRVESIRSLLTITNWNVVNNYDENIEFKCNSCDGRLYFSAQLPIRCVSAVVRDFVHDFVQLVSISYFGIF